jgi:hypothetical protein
MLFPLWFPSFIPTFFLSFLRWKIKLHEFVTFNKHRKVFIILYHLFRHKDHLINYLKYVTATEQDKV